MVKKQIMVKIDSFNIRLSFMIKVQVRCLWDLRGHIELGVGMVGTNVLYCVLSKFNFIDESLDCT